MPLDVEDELLPGRADLRTRERVVADLFDEMRLLYDLIIVDAYSSDAIPIHLATEEAMEIYKQKLAPHGAVAMHVSNRHLELSSVVVGIADANDMKSWVYSEDSGRDDEYIFSTSVVVISAPPNCEPSNTSGESCARAAYTAAV